MARSTGEKGALDRWAYRIAFAATRANDALQGARGAGAGVGRRAAGAAQELADDVADAADDLDAQAGSAAAATALGIVAAQLLRPRPVNWPRAVLAGTIGTMLYDAGSIVEARRAGRKFRTRPLLGPDPGESLPSMLGRYAAGVGMAGFYARYLYGRLPGPPVVQGLTYGLLESGTRAWGGAVALLGRLSPEVRLPTGYTAGLARADEGPVRALLRHLAFGVGVGLVYRKGE